MQTFIRNRNVMKSQIFPGALVAIVGIATAALSAMPVSAENFSSVSTTVTRNIQAAPQLSYGAANVLKLSQAKIGDETIIAYVQKSGEGYSGLGASEIIYLHEQGVSSQVVTTMLDQEKKRRDAAAAQSLAQQITLAAPQAITPSAPVATAPQYQQTYAAPPVTYVQTAPAELVVMRDSSPRLVDYGIYPGYGYYGYSYPAVSLAFGYGGGYYRGGYYGGGYYGGGSYCGNAGYYGGNRYTVRAGYYGGGGYHGGSSGGGGSGYHGGGSQVRGGGSQVRGGGSQGGGSQSGGGHHR